MKTRHPVRLVTTALAVALLALLGTSTAALAVPQSDGGSGVAHDSSCVAPRQLHLGHREQVDLDSVGRLCPVGNQPTFTPYASAEPARTSSSHGPLVAVLGLVALLAGLTASSAWRRLRGTRPRQAT
jgi:hypothetical protein